jgi:hypothetical protein
VSSALDIPLGWANSIVVGSGMRLFEEVTDQLNLKLVEWTTLSTGVLSVTYQPASG